MHRVGLFMDRGKSCVRDILDGVAQFLDQLPATERWECWCQYDIDSEDLRPLPLDGALAMAMQSRAADEVCKVARTVVGVLGCPSMGFPFPSVVCNDLEVGRAAAKEFLRRGHRELAFISDPQGAKLDHGRLRMQGFSEEAREAGARFHFGAIRGSLRAFLRGLPRPCGVLAITDETGKWVLDACRAEGIRVPQEIAVLGVDNDLQTCELSWPPLGTVQPGHFEVGFQAAKRLHALLQGEPDPANAHIEIVGMPEVVIRASVDTRAVEDELVAKALQHISMHAHEIVGVGEVCDALGVGRRSLELRMRKAIGKSILEELNAVRIQIAKRLLRNRRLSILQVAKLSGFGTQAHFGVVFHRIAGTTATAYRRQAVGLSPPG